MAIEIEDENIARDLPKFQNYLTEIKKLANDLNTSLQETLKSVQDEKSSVRNGVSLLDVKYHALLQYVVDLVALINCKVRMISSKRLQHISHDSLIFLNIISWGNCPEGSCPEEGIVLGQLIREKELIALKIFQIHGHGGGGDVSLN